MEYGVIYIGLAAIFGLYMAWGIGANDVANAMATSVGAKALTLKQAVFIAAIFEFSGAILAGGSVTSTIRKGMFDASSLAGTPDILVLGMLAALLAAGTWLLIASHMGLPVSTTHSIVGAIIGFACIGIGVDAVKWDKVGQIAASWVISPVTAGLFAFMLFASVQRLVLDAADPLAKAKRYVPFYMFLAGFMMALVTMLKGLKHVGLDLSQGQAYGYAVVVGVVVALIGAFFIRKIEPRDDTRREQYNTVERIFGVLMILTACCMAFAHGSNDVANAIGPVAAVVSTVQTGLISQKSALPIWVLLLGGFGIVIGLATFGRQVMATVGENITHLTPSRGFAAELAAATTVVVASGTGMPVSTTHTLVGAVLGIGIARGITSINLGVVRSIFMSWVITLPAGAGLAVLFYGILHAIFL